ncbi:MAG: methylmalonyl-CoA epimerase [Planctomycetota bacterium]
MRLDHVAIAVPSIDAVLPLWAGVLGLAPLELEDVPEQGVRVKKLDTGNTHIELLEPLVAGEGPIGKHIDKRGAGIHHICFRVDDIDAAATRLKAAGYRALSDEPQPGANGARVLFLHPKDTGGTLIELAWYPPGS